MTARAAEALQPHPTRPCLVTGALLSWACHACSPMPQALLMRLLRERVGCIVGEEEEAGIDIEAPPFRAGEIVAPAELEPLIIRLRGRMDELAAEISPSSELAALTAFLDPIDGTREFCSGLGEQCSICIGFADGETGAAVGGLVYRPLCSSGSWALGCAREAAKASVARPPPAAFVGKRAAESDAPRGAFLCSNGSVSPFLKALQADLGFAECRQGGAGNKALMLLEVAAAGSGSSCYIQDRGVSRWDTCAAQAVIEAHGGMLTRLDAVVDSPRDDTLLPTYTYLKGSLNSIFVPGLSHLTPYNAQPGVLSAEEQGSGAARRMAAAAEEVKPYANVCGLFALAPGTDGDAKAMRTAVKRAAAIQAPAFD